jgi:hypothetical protein
MALPKKIHRAPAMDRITLAETDVAATLTAQITISICIEYFFGGWPSVTNVAGT